MKTVARRALVVGATADGEKSSVIAVSCPYCRSIHRHRFWHDGDPGYRLCANGTPAGVYLIVFPPTQKEGSTMPDQPDQLAPRIPAGAVIITPERADVGFGYVAETSADVVYLTIFDARRGPHTVLFAAPVAFDVADQLNAKAAKLTALRATTRAIENGEADDE